MIRSPFNISKTSFPLHIDLMLKLIVIVPILKPYLYQSYPKLPFLDFINEIGSTNIILWVISIVTIIGVLITLLNITPRLGISMITLSLLVTAIWCRPCYSDSRLYIISLLVLLILYQKDNGVKLLRWQVIILYFGSGINKVFDPDWQTGIYIDNWLDNKINFSLYKEYAPILTHLLLAKTISWFVIITELFMSFCFTKKAYFKLGIWLGIVMHSSSVIIVNHMFGSFVAAVIISYLAFLEWPKNIILSLPKTKVSNFIKKYNHIIDPYHNIIILINCSSNKIELQLKDRKITNFQALQKVIIYTPIFYFFMIVLILLPGYGYDWIKGLLLLIFSIMILPIVGKTIDKFIQEEN